ncbi:MAG: PQQ-binding-like beta-propeller repeat protein [Pseudomonadota bacterium]
MRPIALLLVLAACHPEAEETAAPVEEGWGVPLAPDSPWPKFRRGPAQSGRSTVSAADGAGDPWIVSTNGAIFSSPVIDADGTVYIGSADRKLYAISAEHETLWTVGTGEIIDSSGLLDEDGLLWFGSGDGQLRGVDVTTGEVLKRFDAEDPSETQAYINWFEGNVAMAADGSLLVPNDNFRIYNVDRGDTFRSWSVTMQDQTWSCPAVDVASGDWYVGNNLLLDWMGSNTFAFDATGDELWSASNNGTIAASPLLTADGKLIVGGFDGFLRAYDAASGEELWSFAARDHIYASPAELSDGTLIQPAADGTVYALNPADGSLRWAFDTLEPLRSSPAVDAEDHIYFGSGDGHLYVLEPAGTLRWSLELTTSERNDLNSSPAIGPHAVVIASEDGRVFSTPLDWCLGAAGAASEHCRAGGGEDLPEDGAEVFWVTPAGGLQEDPPAEVSPNAALCFSLLVREAGDTLLALVDSESLQVSAEPSVPLRVEVTGDRRFVTVEPEGRFTGEHLDLTIAGDYLVDPERDGLATSGGTVGGTFQRTFSLDLATPAGGQSLPLDIPGAPGDTQGVWVLHGLAAPIPTILPSYNQIGFASLFYLVGLVEGDGQHAVAWVIGAQPTGDTDLVAPDPATTTVFPMEVGWDEGLLTLSAPGGMAVEVMNFSIAFERFRVSSLLDEHGTSLDAPVVHVTTLCDAIPFYGAFLDTLGFCNPQTGALDVFGTAWLAPWDDPGAMPADPGDVVFTVADGMLRAALGNALALADHRYALLAVDAATGSPLALEYQDATEVLDDGAGQVAGIQLDLEGVEAGTTLRVHLMIDTYPAASGEVEVPQRGPALKIGPGKGKILRPAVGLIKSAKAM